MAIRVCTGPMIGLWPPVGGGEPNDDYMYGRLAEAGYEYGPAFQGLREAFRAGEELFAELRLDDDVDAGGDGVRLHPALGGAAMEAAVLWTLDSQKSDKPLVPFEFANVRLYQRGVGSLRLRVRQGEQGTEMSASDSSGEPVFSVGSLQLRPLEPGQLQGGWSACPRVSVWVAVGGVCGRRGNGRTQVRARLGGSDELGLWRRRLRVGLRFRSWCWSRSCLCVGGGELAEAVHEVTERTLELLQAWLRSDQLADSRLVRGHAAGRRDPRW